LGRNFRRTRGPRVPTNNGTRVTHPSGFGNLNWFWKGCKPNSVFALANGENHLSYAADTRNPSRFRETWSGQLRGSLFGLAPDGVFRASSLTLRAVRSYRTFSPLPVPLAKRRRSDFLWHCPSESLSTFRPRVSSFCDGHRPPPQSYAASRPLVFGLSSPDSRRKRFSALPKPL